MKFSVPPVPISPPRMVSLAETQWQGTKTSSLTVCMHRCCHYVWLRTTKIFLRLQTQNHHTIHKRSLNHSRDQLYLKHTEACLCLIRTGTHCNSLNQVFNNSTTDFKTKSSEKEEKSGAQICVRISKQILSNLRNDSFMLLQGFSLVQLDEENKNRKRSMNSFPTTFLIHKK